MLISIITPLLNEEGNITSFLEMLNRVEGSFELIFVDGGSTDKTFREIEENKRRFGFDIRLFTSCQGRAVQLNKGAQNSKAEILLFLHVDCILPSNALRLIEKAFSRKHVVGGGFKQAFSTNNWYLKIISCFGNLRAQLTEEFFGDYGIFVKKDVFTRIGGYRLVPFLEDVDLCKKIRQYGRMRQIDSYLFTSSRRYRKWGSIRLTLIFIFSYFFTLFNFRPYIFTKYIVDK